MLRLSALDVEDLAIISAQMQVSNGAASTPVVNSPSNTQVDEGVVVRGGFVHLLD